MSRPTSSPAPSDVLRTGRRVYLRPPRPEDCDEFLAFVRASRRLHRPWVYPPADPAAFRSFAERARSERFLGCLIRLRETHEIAGVANLSEIVRGIFQSAYLGFYGSARHAGQGLMKEGLALLLRHVFQDLGLHRVEANVQPANLRSRGLVEALGFRLEGFSPRYLKIGGRWRDHERWAILAEGSRVEAERRRASQFLSNGGAILSGSARDARSSLTGRTRPVGRRGRLSRMRSG